jgi:hypothetical protein
MVKNQTTTKKKPATKKNAHAAAAKKKSLLGELDSEAVTKGNLKNTAIETGKMILLGVFAGGLGSAIIGKNSFGIGLLTAGIGHYTGNRIISIMGLGMMATSGVNRSSGVSGLEGLDGVKERVMAFKEDLLDKTYLNRILPKSSTAASSKSVGALQYFNYPGDVSGHAAALASIENQLLESGMQFQQNNGGSYANTGYAAEMEEERIF